MIVSSAVAPLTTQTPSKEREERTGNFELKVQVDRIWYPYLQKCNVQKKWNRLERVLHNPSVMILENQLAVRHELPGSQLSGPVANIAKQRLRAKMISHAASKAQASAMRLKHQDINEVLTSKKNSDMIPETSCMPPLSS